MPVPRAVVVLKVGELSVVMVRGAVMSVVMAAGVATSGMAAEGRMGRRCVAVAEPSAIGAAV